MKRRAKSAALVLWTLLAAPCAVLVAAGPTPFMLIGPIEEFKLDTPATSACGSSVNPALISSRMTVHGVKVLIPCNLIIQMPATYLTADDIFKLNPGPGGASESGLALDDKTKPIAAFEATIIGNIVKDLAGNPTYVAGLAYISQHSLATGAGYIKDIDLKTREIRVGPDPTTPVLQQDAHVRINDVTGVYDHLPFTTNVDKRFTVDIQNPTVHALTGYPMCLPKARSKDDPDDEHCPAANRPIKGGKALINFVMGPNSLPAAPPDAQEIPSCPGCEPGEQAPFMKGDYITYSGTLAKETKDTKEIYISAHTIVANVGIFTQRGIDPAYVSLDESLVGTMGPLTQRDPANPGPTLPQETQDRLRIEGFTTDPSRDVEIYAIDVNAVTGEQRLRLLNVVRPQSVPFGRFRLIVGKRAGILFDSANTPKGATRELMVHIHDPTDPKLDGELIGKAGPARNYVAPVGEYIFPENTVLGDPLVPNNFECVAFLQQGSGPLATIEGRPGPLPVVSRLVPWPGLATASRAINCSP